MREWFDGVACGIIFCAWFAGATSEQVALIRLPATLFLTISLAAYIVAWFRRRRARASEESASQEGSEPS